MGNFIHGWRRKAGCTSLVLACLTTAVWITCLYNERLINRLILDRFPCNNGDIRLYTFGNSISLVRCEEFTTPQRANPAVSETIDANQIREGETRTPEDSGQATNVVAPGSVAVATLVTLTINSIIDVPFWLIVSPLILLSAYFLLVKTGSKSTDSSSGQSVDAASQ
jgi:hypothetical protein